MREGGREGGREGAFLNATDVTYLSTLMHAHR